MLPTAGQHWPIGCVGNCQQGGRPCTAPLLCSGASREVDEALAQFRTAPRAPVVLRQPLPKTFEPDFGMERPPADEGPGLLSSPVFWIDGAICLLCWFALYLVLTR